MIDSTQVCYTFIWKVDDFLEEGAQRCKACAKQPNRQERDIFSRSACGPDVPSPQKQYKHGQLAIIQHGWNKDLGG